MYSRDLRRATKRKRKRSGKKGKIRRENSLLKNRQKNRGEKKVNFFLLIQSKSDSDGGGGSGKEKGVVETVAVAMAAAADVAAKRLKWCRWQSGKRGSYSSGDGTGGKEGGVTALAGVVAMMAVAMMGVTESDEW